MTASPGCQFWHVSTAGGVYSHAASAWLVGTSRQSGLGREGEFRCAASHISSLRNQFAHRKLHHIGRCHFDAVPALTTSVPSRQCNPPPFLLFSVASSPGVRAEGDGMENVTGGAMLQAGVTSTLVPLPFFDAKVDMRRGNVTSVSCPSRFDGCGVTSSSAVDPSSCRICLGVWIPGHEVS